MLLLLNQITLLRINQSFENWYRSTRATLQSCSCSFFTTLWTYQMINAEDPCFLLKIINVFNLTGNNLKKFSKITSTCVKHQSEVEPFLCEPSKSPHFSLPFPNIKQCDLRQPVKNNGQFYFNILKGSCHSSRKYEVDCCKHESRAAEMVIANELLVSIVWFMSDTPERVSFCPYQISAWHNFC